MNDSDLLSKLMKNWQPQSPHSTERFVQDTMRKIRLGKEEPALKRWTESFGELLSEWLPAPRILLPVAASIVILFGIVQGLGAIGQAKTVAALSWHEQLSHTRSNVSLTGAYSELSKN